MKNKGEKNNILFSIGSLFSYNIDRMFYKNIHYVWCTTRFDVKTQPITSNPYNICQRFLDQILSGDRHAHEIEDNKAGILRGAQAKLEEGVIDSEQFNEICQMVNLARYEDFFPVLYIIDANKIDKKRCIEVEKQDRASDISVEYRIVDLSEGEYEMIDFKSLISKYVEVADRKAGK